MDISLENLYVDLGVCAQAEVSIFFLVLSLINPYTHTETQGTYNKIPSFFFCGLWILSKSYNLQFKNSVSFLYERQSGNPFDLQRIN